MGVCTKAILNGNIDAIQIAKDIIADYGTDRGRVSVSFTSIGDEFFYVNFLQKYPENYRELGFTERGEWVKNNSRSMAVHYNCECDYADVTTETMTYVSLGARGDAGIIMESLLRKYGGFIIRDDSMDEWEKFNDD